VGQRLRVSKIVGGDKFDSRIVKPGSNYIPPDPAEAVDSHFDWHVREFSFEACIQFNFINAWFVAGFANLRLSSCRAESILGECGSTSEFVLR
jgi:hypothetical protein